MDNICNFSLQNSRCLIDRKRRNAKMDQDPALTKLNGCQLHSAVMNIMYMTTTPLQQPEQLWPRATACKHISRCQVPPSMSHVSLLVHGPLNICTLKVTATSGC